MPVDVLILILGGMVEEDTHIVEAFSELWGERVVQKQEDGEISYTVVDERDGFGYGGSGKVGDAGVRLLADMVIDVQRLGADLLEESYKEAAYGSKTLCRDDRYDEERRCACSWPCETWKVVGKVGRATAFTF